MRPFRVLTLYLLVVFVGGAIAAPWVAFAVQWVHQGTEWPFLREVPFHRIVNRCLLVLALAGAIPLTRSFGIRRWQDLGFTKDPRAGWRALGQGFVVGLISLAAIVGLSMIAGARELRAVAPGEVVQAAARAALSGIAVGFLEETLFRGVLFGGFRRFGSWQVALVVSSAVYAITHFFARPPSPGELHWWTGLVHLGQMFAGFGVLTDLIPGFLNLCVVGAVLALAVQYSGSLYLAIGLHAGWVFWLKMIKLWSTTPQPEATVLWGSQKLIDGWAMLPALGVTGAAVFWLSRTHARREA